MAFGTWPRGGFLSRISWCALAAVILLVAGCGGGGGGDDGGGGGGGTATLTGRAVDVLTGQGVAGAVVTYAGASAASDANGNFSISVGAPAQAQRLRVTATSYRNLGQLNGITYRLGTEGIPVGALTVGQSINIGTIQLYSNEAPPPPPSL